jgi:WD40 repeat protein
MDRHISLWDVQSGTRMASMGEADHVVTAIALSPDGKTIVAGDSDGLLESWDIETGRLRGALSEHQGAVSGLAFSPDGRKLVTGGTDRTLRVWTRGSGSWVMP